MTVSTWLSYVCALFAAAGNALANVMQRKASLEQPPDTPFGLALLLDLTHRKAWLLGIAGMVGSFLLQAVALSLGELSVVETIITLEVPLSVLIASRVFAGRVGRFEWASIIVMTAGMAVLIGSLDPQPGNETDVQHVTYAVAGGGTAATIVALVLASRHRNRAWRTVCLGAAAGTSFGLTASFVKESLEQLSARGMFGLVTTWQTYAAISFGVLGVVIMQWALHSGSILYAQPGFTLMDPLVAILWGVLVFHETTRSGFWLVPATIGAIGVGAGVAALARSPLLAALGDDEPGGEPELPDAPPAASGKERFA